jgi:hypothetical protein
MGERRKPWLRFYHGGAARRQDPSKTGPEPEEACPKTESSTGRLGPQSGCLLEEAPDWSALMNSQRLLAVALLLSAIGCAQEESAEEAPSAELALRQGPPRPANNTGTTFDAVTADGNLSVDEAYLHTPTNNLYGNRMIVVGLLVTNVSYEKEFTVVVDGNSFSARFDAKPLEQVAPNTAQASFAGSSGGRDRFWIVVHGSFFQPRSTIEVVASQDGGRSVFRQTLRLRREDPSINTPLSITERTERDELKFIGAGWPAFTGLPQRLVLDVDVQDIDPRAHELEDARNW